MRTNTRTPMIAGALAVGLMLAGTRWASYLGIPPLFPADVLLICAAVHHLLKQNKNSATILRPREFPTGIVLVFIYCTIRFIVGADLSLVAIRDAVPYLYTITGLLAWSSVSQASDESLEKTRKFFTAALGFHAVWFFVVVIVYPPLPEIMPLVSAEQNLHMFTGRGDVDTALTGVMGAILLHKLIEGGTKRKFLTFLALACCWAAFLHTQSRAGLIGALVAHALVMLAAFAAPEGPYSKKKLGLIGLFPFVVVGAAALVMTSDIGVRLLATFTGDESSTLSEGAAGTTRARNNAWAAISQWVFDDPARTTAGIGFGPNFMGLSGADVQLIGSAVEGVIIPRSPHNFWFGSLARLGLFGLILLLAATAGFVLRALRDRRFLAVDPTRLLFYMVPLSLIFPASYGVVLESPFGAIPFWWCIGAALALGPARRPTIPQQVRLTSRAGRREMLRQTARARPRPAGEPVSGM